MISHSEQETFNVARELAASLPIPAHVLLYGDLGAGKTAFARGLAVGFGIDDPRDVSSPTFTLVNQYRGRLKIYHIDLYRIEPGTIHSLGLEDILDDPGAAVIVEWAERMRGLEPPDAVRVFLEYLGADSRKIEIHTPKR